MSAGDIRFERRGRLAVVTLNRPKALNALNAQVVAELNRALEGFDHDPDIAVMVVTGSERAFAAGADVKEMEGKDFIAAFRDDFIAPWQQVAACTKPVIAAAAGMDQKESDIVLSLFQFPRRDAQLSERWMDGGVQSFVKQVADFYVKQGRIPAALDDYGPTIDASFYERVQ